MARQTVGVDVTAHKEERNVTDPKKNTKLRVCYYVEIVVGSPRENHTRLGFSGSFQALLRLHREFMGLYVDKHGDPHGGLLAGRESFLSNSSSTSRSSVSSAKGSPTSLSNFVRHTFGIKKKKSAGEGRTEGEGTSNNQEEEHVRHHHQRNAVAAMQLPGIEPFPTQNKLLVHLESGEAKNDAKIDSRNTALFEYYSRLFNSEDGEMYLNLVTQRALEKAGKNRSELSENEPKEPSSHSGIKNGLLKRLGHHPKVESTKSHKNVEFFEPVYVRARRKSRGHRTAA